MSVLAPSRPIVQGKPSRRICVTGVGNAPSDGPRSARASRAQKRPYCSSGVPCSPYRSSNALRSVSGARGAGWPAAARRHGSPTGSLGSNRGTMNVTVVPTKMTTAHWIRRGRAYDFRKLTRIRFALCGCSDPLEGEATPDEPVQRLARGFLGGGEAVPVLHVLGDELLEADGVQTHHVLNPELHHLAA